MATYSTDTDMSGVLLTTEWGNPPQNQPAGVDNYQGYGVTGQGVQKVYKYLYDPTDNVAPTDESEGALALQEQEWVGEVEFLQQADPQFLEGADITGDVVFENPLDTLNVNATLPSDGTNTVDFDREVDPLVDDPVAYGVPEFGGAGVEQDIARAESEGLAPTPAPETVSEPPQASEAAEAPVVAPEPTEAPAAPVANPYRPANEQE